MSTPDFFETQDVSSFEDTRKEPEPAPVVNVAVRHRRLTPRPSREHILHKLVEATTEVNRLGALLAATPEPEARDEPGSKPNSVRGHHGGAPSTATGTETEASSYLDEPYQPEGPPLPRKSPEMSVVSETSYDLLAPFSSR